MPFRRVAIIPARGGSKRIPRKNIKDFHGKPIISYSIDAALSAGCFDSVIVSTDDGEIADVARSFGAEVPFMRSADASGDAATTAAALTEVLEGLAVRGRQFDLACCLYPAAPFITSEMLLNALAIMEADEADSCMSVFPIPVWRALQSTNGRLSRIWPEYQNARSQDLPPAYLDAGQFYWFAVARFLQVGRILNDNTVPFIMSPEEVQDIDTPDDWKSAEGKFTKYRS